MPRTLLLVACIAASDAFVAPLHKVDTPLAVAAVKREAAAVEGEKPKTPPLGSKLVLPGDDDLNYGTTIVSCAVASFLMLTAALPSDWQARPEISGLVGKQLEWFKDAPVFVDDKFGAPKTDMFEDWALAGEDQEELAEVWEE